MGTVMAAKRRWAGTSIPKGTVALISAFVIGGCMRGSVVEVASGFQIQPSIRSTLANDGTVVAAQPTAFLVGNGGPLTTVDLAPHGLTVTGAKTRPVRVRTAGDIVFVAACTSSARGAYRIGTTGGALTTLFENCPEVASEGAVKMDIGLSPNGTVAFSQIRNGMGAIYRGPAAGPVTSLRTGTGGFYNTGALDLNDAGRTVVQMEYFDGFAGGLMRAMLLFDTPEQAKEDIDTAIEKMSIGSQPPLAINAAGTVAFAVNGTLSFPIAGTMYTYEPGVYVSTPTPFNTPKDLTLLVGLGGAYCHFGAVDINDDGVVVFEASLTGGLHCDGLFNDGLYTGPNASANEVVSRGQARLGGHQYFDDILLGEINATAQVSFITTYSEPLVDPVKVWRWDP